jgi:hypothetical protein
MFNLQLFVRQFSIHVNRMVDAHSRLVVPWRIAHGGVFIHKAGQCTGKSVRQASRECAAFR